MHFKENCQKQFKLKQVLLLAFTLLFAMVAGVAVYASQVKEVNVNNKGVKICVKTMGNTVGDVLTENEIYINKDDIVLPAENSPLSKTSNIEIKEKIVVPQQEVVKQPAVTDLLKEKAEPKKAILQDKNIITKKTITVKGKIPYRVENKPNGTMLKGESKIIKQGKQGVVEKQYQVVCRNGKEVSRKLIVSKVIKQPVTKVVSVGTKTMIALSRGGTIRVKEVYVMKATAYDNSYASTGKKSSNPGYGITATGMRTRRGVVAVDPRVIPLGSRLYIESMQKGVPDYGYAIAGDTGGAIKGKKIDVFLPTAREVDNWGVRNVKVYVLE